MASTIVEIQLPPGTSGATLSLYSLTNDSSLANSGGADALTEETDASGFFRATVTESLTGVYRAKVLSGATVLATGYIDIIDDAGVYRVEDSHAQALVNAVWRRFYGKVTLDASSVKTIAADGTTVLTSQPVSDDGTTQTQGAVS